MYFKHPHVDLQSDPLIGQTPLLQVQQLIEHCNFVIYRRCKLVAKFPVKCNCSLPRRWHRMHKPLCILCHRMLPTSGSWFTVWDSLLYDIYITMNKWRLGALQGALRNKYACFTCSVIFSERVGVLQKGSSFEVVQVVWTQPDFTDALCESHTHRDIIKTNARDCVCARVVCIAGVTIYKWPPCGRLTIVYSQLHCKERK